jgi:hypothetical protein
MTAEGLRDQPSPLGLFALSLTVGRRARLGYADTATLVFTTTARNSESVLGVAATAFAGHPLVLVAILVGPVIELPALLGLSRLMLHLRQRLSWPEPEREPALARIDQAERSHTHADSLDTDV